MSDRRDVQSSSDFIIRDNLGRATIHPRTDSFRRSRAIQLIPRKDLLTKILALDAEFQFIYDESTAIHTPVIGRIIVNDSGRTIWDVFVHFTLLTGQKIKLPPAEKSFGVYSNDIKTENGAVPIEEVGETLREIIEGRTIVGHSILSDIAAIQGSGLGDVLEYALSYRDTQKHAHCQHVLDIRQPSLRKLYEQVAGQGIQGNGHSSVEDAQATMHLYRLREPQIEVEQAAWGWWLDPPRSEEEMFEEMMYGPDTTYGPQKPRNQGTRFKQEQDELDNKAKQYCAAQVNTTLSQAAMAWKTFKLSSANVMTSTAATQHNVFTPITNETSTSSPGLYSNGRKDRPLSSYSITTGVSSAENSAHPKQSSLSEPNTVVSAEATSITTSLASTKAPHISSPPKVTRPLKKVISAGLAAAKSNAAIKIAYPLDLRVSAGQTTVAVVISDIVSTRSISTSATILGDPLTAIGGAAVKCWSKTAIAAKVALPKTSIGAPGKTALRKRA